MKFCLFCFFFLANVAFGMGGNEFGPNGGYIKMPGAFHLELMDSADTIKVYLLDMNIKNPTVEDSTVDVFLKNKEKIKLICKPITNYFSCEKNKLNLKKFKEIVIHSRRQKAKGFEVSFKLPLELDK